MMNYMQSHLDEMSHNTLDKCWIQSWVTFTCNKSPLTNGIRKIHVSRESSVGLSHVTIVPNQPETFTQPIRKSGAPDEERDPRDPGPRAIHGTASPGLGISIQIEPAPAHSINHSNTKHIYSRCYATKPKIAPDWNKANALPQTPSSHWPGNAALPINDISVIATCITAAMQ